MRTGARYPAVIAVVAAMAVVGSAAQAQAQEPPRGGTVRVAAGDPGAINPALTSSGVTHPVTGEIFNGLVRLACTQPAGRRCNYEPVPDLAESWTISPDGKTYVFNLRRGVKWHDGQPFTSADVVYSFEQVLLTRHPRTRTLRDRVIASVTAAGPNQVVFSLNQRYSPLLLFLDEDNGAILPAHLFEGTDPATNPHNCPTVENCQTPVGTGPFKFDSRQAGSINLVRNDDYHEPGRPYLDGIIFRFIAGPDATTAFEREEVDLINPDTQQISRLRDELGATITEEGREGFARVVRLIPNLRPCDDPKAPPVCGRTGGVNPFADKNVRKAIAFAIDKDELNRVEYGGLAQPATGPLTRFLEPFYNPDTQPQYDRDVARANQLLDAAGLPRGSDGVRFRLTFIYDPGFAQAAAALKRQLGEVGIELTLDEKPFGAWVKQLYIDGNFDFGYSNITDPADPEIGLRRTVTCGNISPPAPFTNGAAYCNPQLDSLFDQAAQEPDEAARARLYFEIQDVLADEQPYIYAIDVIGPYAYYAKRFRGFEAAAPKTPYYFGRTVFGVKPSTGTDPETGKLRDCPGATNAISATSGDDKIAGTAANDNIFAGAGNDEANSLPGNDCIDLGTGDDRGQGGAGADGLQGDSGDDGLSGNDGDDKVQGGAGKDRVFGRDGADGVSGNAGDDTVRGGPGKDRVFGRDGADGVSGNAGDDTVRGGPGKDRVFGRKGSDRLSGNAGDDTVSGGAGADRIFGRSGVDRLLGGPGDDLIVARDGRRDGRIACGRGRDTVIADRVDRVADDCERVLRAKRGGGESS